MAILDSEKLDFLWKKMIFGMTKSAKSADKAGSNEIVPSPVTVYPSKIWKDEADIPAFAPTTETAPVKPWVGVDRIAATTDPTSTPNLTWFATETQGDIDTRLGDFIPPSFGSSYAVRVFIGDPNVGPAARLFPDTTNEEWVFDYTSGVLIFASAIPGSKPATIGSGNVSIATDGIYLEVCQYVGEAGAGASLLDELDDVEIGTGLVEGDALVYKDGVWQPGPAGAAHGFALPLGDIVANGDGAWTGGAVPLDDATPVSEAVDRMNEVLGKLIPPQPPVFPNGVNLSAANGAGSQPRLADGYTDNAGAAVAPGTAVSRITAASLNSNTFGDVGPGDIGTIAVFVNGAVSTTRALNGTTDNGSYAGLVIADQKDFPVSTPGFWKSLDISLNGLALAVGLNAVRISHGEGGQTNTLNVMRDSLTANPVISAGSVTEAALGTPAYSSGVPHYGTGGQLTVAMSIANLAGQTYYGGADPIQFSGPVIATKTFTYAPATGIDAPIPAGTTTAQPVTPQTIAVDGTGHTSGKVSGVARNVNGTATTDLGGPTILIKRGASGARIDEGSVSAMGGTAVRKGSGAGDTPAGAPAAWVSSAALAAHEAAVVGGVLRHDQTDYSENYLPAGPDLSSGRSGAQYVTFSFNRAAVSAFKIVVTGSYAGCRIRLPGASDSAPNAPNGWWDAFKAYDGAGVPGENGDPDAGCALGGVMTGGSGTFQITFGTQSSTNATDNEILIRFRLNAGQSITALSFTA